MKIVKTVLILCLHVNIIVIAHAQESCHVGDIDCNVGAQDPMTFLKNNDILVEENQSWTTMLWDQINAWKDSIVGTSLPAVPEANDALTEDDVARMFNMDTEMDHASMMKYAQNLASSFLEGDQLTAFNELASNVLPTLDVEDENNSFEYPPVENVKPHVVGHVQYRELEEGIQTKIVTRSTNPPIFEIPNFLSPSECNLIIEKSEEKGLFESTMFQSQNRTETGINKGIQRISYSTNLHGKNIDRDFLNKLHNRVAKLLSIPKEVVQWSEHLTIGMYKQGGHYYAHLDSNEANRNTPCCFQKICYDSNQNESDNSDCCRMCRYATLLYYLNDVEEGGETAFPMADLKLNEMLKKQETEWKNLTEACHKASVVVKPEKGKAILWYNHFIDKHGYIDSVDIRSYHGGCDVIKGNKWIATNWISTPLYHYRYMESKYREGFNEYMGLAKPDEDLDDSTDSDRPSVDPAENGIEEILSVNSAEIDIEDLPSGNSAEIDIKDLPSGNSAEIDIKDLPSGNSAESGIEDIPSDLDLETPTDSDIEDIQSVNPTVIDDEDIQNI